MSGTPARLDPVDARGYESTLVDAVLRQRGCTLRPVHSVARDVTAKFRHASRRGSPSARRQVDKIAPDPLTRRTRRDLVGDRRGRLHRFARGAGIPERGIDCVRAGRSVQRPPGVSCPTDVPLVAAPWSTATWSRGPRRARRQRRRAPGRLQVRRGLGRRPLHTYTQNVTGTVVAAGGDGRARRRAGSSSPPAPRSTAPRTPTWSPRRRPTRPESPYGESKLIGEWLLRDQARRDRRWRTRRCATSTWSARATPELRDTSPHNLFPIVFDQLVDGRRSRTSTATTTRRRTAPASATTCTWPISPPRTWRRPSVLDAGRTLEPVYNLGSGDGLSVRQIMDGDRPGDRHRLHRRRSRRGAPATRRASWPRAELAARDLDWRMRHTVDEMVRSAWEAREAAL